MITLQGHKARCEGLAHSLLQIEADVALVIELDLAISVLLAVKPTIHLPVLHIMTLLLCMTDTGLSSLYIHDEMQNEEIQV